MDETGGLVWQLVLCLILAWVVAVLCMIKGIDSIGKVGRNNWKTHAEHYYKICNWRSCLQGWQLVIVLPQTEIYLKVVLTERLYSLAGYANYGKCTIYNNLTWSKSILCNVTSLTIKTKNNDHEEETNGPEWSTWHVCNSLGVCYESQSKTWWTQVYIIFNCQPLKGVQLSIRFSIWNWLPLYRVCNWRPYTICNWQPFIGCAIDNPYFQYFELETL